ncbi:hypothetical protein VP01_1960g5 [Puccinia sorghi]|uniref:Retrovirus-related Pol polyprotein from transposon TNT 1-94-like beta-barrel domain-containing protein n=1 Tax=Puccinia sorghi TaxID=27349 RepID=A0A0L6VC16_9BASI|nr:hypothetical protein VP01_1960g5 [Puccinia sorghi]
MVSWNSQVTSKSVREMRRDVSGILSCNSDRGGTIQMPRILKQLVGFFHFQLYSGLWIVIAHGFDINLFITIDLKEQGVVQTSSGHDSLEIKGIGTIKLSNEFGDLILNCVLYVPNLVINLLSFRCLVLVDFDVQFLKNSFSLSRNNQIVLSRRYEGNLPCLNFCNPKEKSYLSSSKLLHKSLGHVSYHQISQKLGIPLGSIVSCEACALSKITQASFKSKHKKASQPFEELHLDLIGPISDKTRSAL